MTPNHLAVRQICKNGLIVLKKLMIILLSSTWKTRTFSLLFRQMHLCMREIIGQFNRFPWRLRSAKGNYTEGECKSALAPLYSSNPRILLLWKSHMISQPGLMGRKGKRLIICSPFLPWMKKVACTGWGKSWMISRPAGIVGMIASDYSFYG